MENQKQEQQKQFTPLETSINILLEVAIFAQSKGILNLKQASQVNAAVEFLTTPQQEEVLTTPQQEEVLTTPQQEEVKTK